MLETKRAEGRTSNRATSRGRQFREDRGDKQELTDPRHHRDTKSRHATRRDVVPRSVRNRVAVQRNEITARTAPKTKQQSQDDPRNAKRIRRVVGHARFFDSQPLEKLFVVFGFAVAMLLVFPFGCDLVSGWPFHRASLLFDASSVLCGLGLGYLSWDTLKDLF